MQDFLSIVFDDLHLTQAEYFFIAAAGSWAGQITLPGRAVFHAVLQGGLQVEVAGEVLSLEAGDILILPTGHHHLLKAVQVADRQSVPDLSDRFRGRRHEPIQLGTGELSAYLISASCGYDAELGQPLVSALPVAIPIRGLQASPPEWLRIGLQFLLQETGEFRQGQQSILNRLGDIWFLECLRTYIDSLPDGNQSWLRALKDPALATVLSAIHQRPGHDWRVPELATLACLSRSAFADRFQRIMGKPPLTYVSEHRMRLAAWQLRHSDQPVCRIAEQIGYASETAFGQAFKRTHGLAPGKYRAQLRQAAENLV